VAGQDPSARTQLPPVLSNDLAHAFFPQIRDEQDRMVILFKVDDFGPGKNSDIIRGEMFLFDLNVMISGKDDEEKAGTAVPAEFVEFAVIAGLRIEQIAGDHEMADPLCTRLFSHVFQSMEAFRMFVS
jgi:hypothetical protein